MSPALRGRQQDTKHEGRRIRVRDFPGCLRVHTRYSVAGYEASRRLRISLPASDFRPTAACPGPGMAGFQVFPDRPFTRLGWGCRRSSARGERPCAQLLIPRARIQRQDMRRPRYPLLSCMRETASAVTSPYRKLGSTQGRVLAGGGSAGLPSSRPTSSSKDKPACHRRRSASTISGNQVL